MLIVFSGLPGTGKTTLASAVAAATDVVYLRIDTIEQAIRGSAVLAQGVGRSGYEVANELALSNLLLGNRVLVDCVNPVAESRQAWAQVAARAGVALVDIYVVCSDPREHQRRVETRQGDIPGLVPPTWQSVLEHEHEYEAWGAAPFTLDTALLSVTHAVDMIVARTALPRRAGQSRLPG